MRTPWAPDEPRLSRSWDNSEVPGGWWVTLRENPDPEIRTQMLDTIARHYQSLVLATSFKFKSTLPSYITAEDLHSYGQPGLLKAIERYEPSRGPFRRFASSYVYGAILDELRAQDWAPRGLRKEQRLVRQATVRLRNTEEEPSVASIAAHLGWDAARLESTIRQVENSSHQTLEGAETEDGVLLDEQALDGHVNVTMMCTAFVETFDAFDEVTQYVLVRIYFLSETLTAVAAATHLPLAVVRRIHLEAVNNLFDQVQSSIAH